MTEYKVIWTIDLDADSAEDAAWQALAIQRDVGSTALVFTVVPLDADEVIIDLGDTCCANCLGDLDGDRYHVSGKNCDDDDDEDDTDDEVCSVCGSDGPPEDFHLHQGQFIGGCCWDDRLKASE